MHEPFDIANALKEIVLPHSCWEVNLEYESLKKIPEQRRILRECAKKCRGIQLSRCDGTKIMLDEEYSMEFTWEGQTWKPADRDDFWQRGHIGDYIDATYHVIRLCWREKVPERKYMHYDHWDCLRSDGITPIPLDNVSEDEGNE